MAARAAGRRALGGSPAAAGDRGPGAEAHDAVGGEVETLRVLAVAPNRVDLAGGTLDIYPLYLLLDGALTVNAAVTLESRVEARSRSDGRIVIRSEDTGAVLEAASWDRLPVDGPLALAARAVRYWRPPGGCEVVTCNHAPPGSGLGASSALLLALCAALAALDGRPPARDHLVRVAADLEVQVIGGPGGRQDHYAAAAGGVNAIWFEPASDRLEPLGGPELAEELSRRLVVACVGEPHRSAVPNWRMVRAFIEGRPRTRQALARIKKAAAGMRRALAEGPDWDAAAAWMREEWRWRRRAARGVTTPAVDAAVEAALAAGAAAAKVCGAGGGGSVVALAPPGAREAVARALAARGLQVLPVRVDTEGLRLRLLDE